MEQLIYKGCTDPEALYGALRENNIISTDELQEIEAIYLSESVRHLRLPTSGLRLD